MQKKYKIKHDANGCIGCGACASAAPEYWKMNSDGKACFINLVSNDMIIFSKDFSVNLEAAECCPVNCIHIFEIKNENDNNTEEKVI